ncbi:MAG: type III pantothenate kinase [Chloroflexi bacterium]|nr:type III pantothenate kinase [Chloroflexota bacterium]
MLLAVDVGNTNIVAGVFEGDRLIRNWRLATDRRKTTDEYGASFHTLLDHRGLAMRDITGFALSSTVPPLTATFRRLAEEYFDLPPVIAGIHVKTGVTVATANPPEVGPDRIVNSLAAMKRHRLPAIVIDFGTATTFDAVSADGRLLGCAIAPGMESALDGLVARAARLFSVELKAPRTAIGRNTVTALRSGLVLGYIGLVEGLVARIRLEMEGDPLVIATGGLAEAVAPETNVVDVIDPDLTLHGLRFLYDLNAEAVANGQNAPA